MFKIMFIINSFVILDEQGCACVLVNYVVKRKENCRVRKKLMCFKRERKKKNILVYQNEIY